MKKTVAFLLAISCIGLASCGPVGVTTHEKDESKTYISVRNTNGGVGRAWLDNAIARYEEARKDAHFADGKTGVKVEVSDGIMNPASMKQDTYQVYFNGTARDIEVLSKEDKLYDISSIVTDNTRVGGALSTIITDAAKQKTFFDGKYYALPHYNFYYGASYDAEAFANNNAYFAAEDETEVIEYTGMDISITRNFVGSPDAKKSAGSDGEYGTIDDGLPCSLEEFILLMDYFKNQTEYAPIMVSGTYLNYINYFLQGLWPALAGVEQIQNYYNCTGEIEIVDGYTDEPIFPGIDYIKKPKVKKVTLTEEDKNGYLGQQMVAKYYSFAAVEIMEREGYFSADSYLKSVDHYGAQKCLIYDGCAEYKKVAMLVEASYWYNESKKAGVLSTYEMLTGDTEPRDVRFMPLPTSYYTPEETTKSPTCYFTALGSYCTVNANIKNDEEAIKAVLDFVAFLYSEEELKAFTIETGVSRALDYTLSETEINSMPAFYQQIWRMKSENGANIAYGQGNTTTYEKVKNYIPIALSSPRVFEDSYLTMLRQNNAKTAEGIYEIGTKKLFDLKQIPQSEWESILD
ncbi:MAG: hypothetical protein IJ506_01980 [Clostridia bacterium]|nr:hypothetical protein [Clostridia bacterium]